MLATPASAALNPYLKTGVPKLAVHAIVPPRDAASGLPTGQRMHKPFAVAFELDKSSPLLKGLTVGAKLGEVTFSADEAGKLPATLTDATVESVTTVGVLTTVVVNGVTHEDTWDALKAATGLDKVPAPAVK